MSSASTKTARPPQEDRLAERIVERLEGRGVRKIILFESRVWGEPYPDSDLDVLVILDEDGRSENSAEKGALYRQVSKPLRDLQREMPLDLIVHTEGMHRRFRERDSMFARKVLEEGEVIYENGD
ncbi:nucleotidyltransferase domain-containing protein [Salinibacter ruber]|uniref:nucleotidyltransferase domain-containing protein n=1 Tax=Salinibacter ruber TaxID=146919 RepID=UPI0020732B40|nr:nucleotidyltransferase domain-containing protein [Salinibacter ruber]MCS3708335.1 putative nucleotidyltransferase [Salinibacter ruber]MCS4116142.1 putative nucleotidyltransferase [Salinibacter ruber]MCS4181653.1 putative nucleotidyltransferase [Salinibacter ruber]